VIQNSTEYVTVGRKRLETGLKKHKLRYRNHDYTREEEEGNYGGSMPKQLKVEAVGISVLVQTLKWHTKTGRVQELIDAQEICAPVHCCGICKPARTSAQHLPQQSERLVTHGCVSSRLRSVRHTIVLSLIHLCTCPSVCRFHPNKSTSPTHQPQTSLYERI
jgi:hypothetical protein